MFHYIEGTVADIGSDFIGLECHGICFALAVSTATLAKAMLGEKLILYTYLHVREGIMDLYGFSDKSEKKLFLMLLDISGVGPKAALSLLSSSSTDKLAFAIIQSDEKTLCQAQGIGKKLAQRIILELKEKLAKELSIEPFEDEPGNDTGLLNESRESAISALMVLGYSLSEARNAVNSVSKEIFSTEDIIRTALKNM